MPKKKQISSKSTPPGSLVYVGKKKNGKVNINAFNYTKKRFNKYNIKKVEDLAVLKNHSTVSWINICGISNPNIIKRVGKYFGLHNLLLEDIMDTDNRPKIENFGDYIFVILKSFHFKNKNKDLEHRQISFVLKDNLIISFQESSECDIFAQIENRIREKKGLIRNEKNDYLLYALIDIIIDGYFVVLDDMEEQLDELEKRLLSNPKPAILKNITKLKKEVMLLSKLIWPSKEITHNLSRLNSKLIKESTKRYLMDAHDHTLQILDTIDTFKSTVKGMDDIYLSSVNNKMNEIIKVLTIMTSVFIPLTFITGLYGMNFKNMPEISWHYGYFTVLIAMIVMTVGMVWFFKKKKWL